MPLQAAYAAPARSRGRNVLKLGLDASGQALVYVYARETRDEADIAKMLTLDEVRRIAANVAKLPELLSALAVDR